MPYQPSFDLRGKRIEDTYQQLLQVNTASNLYYNGIGYQQDLIALTAISSSWASQSLNAISSSWASQSLSASYLIYSPNNGSASYAMTASFALNAGSGVIEGASYNITASWASRSFWSTTSSWASQSLSASYLIWGPNNGSASYATQSFNSISASYALTASYALNGGNVFSGTASYISSSATFDFQVYQLTASYAISASYAITSSYIIQSITQSIISSSYASQSFYAVSASWASQSLSAISCSWASQSLSTSYLIYSPNNGSASYAITASYALNAGSGVIDGASYNISASWASRSLWSTTSSYASSSTFAISSSWASQSLSASYLIYSPNNGSASYAITASYALNAGQGVIDGASYNISASWSSRSFWSTTSSYASSSTFSVSSSWASQSLSASYLIWGPNNGSASYATQSFYAVSASYALTASYAMNGITAGGSYNISASWASQSLSTSYAPPQTGNITVFHTDGTSIIYNPSTDTDVARGVILSASVVNAVANDVIKLSAATYDLQNDSIDLSLVNGLVLAGAGKYETVIKSAKNLSTTLQVIVQLGNDSEIKDLSIVGTAAPGVYQGPIGSFNKSFSRAIVRNISTTAGSDGVYIRNSQNSNVSFYASTLSASYDTVATFNTNNTTTSFYDCQFNDTYDSSNEFFLAFCGIKMSNSTASLINAYNCDINIIGKPVAGTTVGCSLDGSGSINLYGGKINRANGIAALSYDLTNTANVGTIGVTANTIYNPALINGSITYLDTNQIIASIGNNPVSRSLFASLATQSLSASYLIYSPNNGSASYAITASYAMNGGSGNLISASYVSGSRSIIGNLSSSIITSSVYYNYMPYTTVYTSSTSWITCSFDIPSQFVTLTASVISGAISFTSSNHPTIGYFADVILFISNSMTSNAPLSFPADWLCMNGLWPLTITAGASAILWLRAYDPSTVIGTYHEHLI